MTETPNSTQAHRYPRIVFLDGILAIVYREEAEKGGKRKYWLVLDDWAKRQLGLKENEDIDYTEAHTLTSGRGVYIKTFDTVDIVPLSNNPEFPLFLGLCSARGESIISADLSPILRLHNTIKNQQAEIGDLKTQLASARATIEDVALYGVKVKKFYEGITPEKQYVQVAPNRREDGK